jgi:hypothetical protein
MNQLSKFHLIITEHLLMNPSLKTTLFTEQLTERFKKTHWEQKNYTLEHFVLQISRQCLFTKCYKSKFLKKIFRRLFYEITSEKCLTFNKLFYFESTTNKTESDTFRSEKTFFFRSKWIFISFLDVSIFVQAWSTFQIYFYPKAIRLQNKACLLDLFENKFRKNKQTFIFSSIKAIRRRCAKLFAGLSSIKIQLGSICWTLDL